MGKTPFNVEKIIVSRNVFLKENVSDDRKVFVLNYNLAPQLLGSLFSFKIGFLLIGHISDFSFNFNFQQFSTIVGFQVNMTEGQNSPYGSPSLLQVSDRQHSDSLSFFQTFIYSFSLFSLSPSLFLWRYPWARTYGWLWRPWLACLAPEDFPLLIPLSGESRGERPCWAFATMLLHKG